jgi:prevent-host-death family protein
MSEKVSTLDIRQRIGDLLNRVALRHDEFVIERKGKPLAALVSIERLEQMRRAARSGLLDLLDRQRPGGAELTDEEADAIGLDAQRWARRRVGDDLGQR